MPRRRARVLTSFHYSLIAFAACAHPASAHAAAVTWTPNASGSWTTATNWSSNPALPGPADNVTINQPGAITVTLSSGTQSINALTDDNTLTLSGGILAVATTLQVNGALALSGGTLQNATLSTTGAGTLTVSSGTFDSVTLASNLPINTSTLTLKDGLTFSGNPTLGLNNGSGLNIINNLTVGGTGIVEFDGTSTASISNAGGALTIGPSVTFQTGTASGVFSPAGLTNQGLISAQTSGKTITISSANFTNSGSLQTLNGATLTINSSNWTNTGNITLDNTSILNLGGTFTTAAIGTINRTGGTINITGIMTNTANTFALTAATGSYVLSTGTILNGNLSIAGGATLTISGGTFDGVTVASNLPINASTLTLKDGLTLSGNPTLSLNNGAGLNINTNLAIGGTGFVEFDGTSTASISNAGGALTIGANVTFQTGTASGVLSPAGLTNLGLISSQTSGKTITISSPNFTNSGSLQALNGGILTINSSNWTSSGNVTLDNTSTLNLGGTFTTAAIGTVIRTGGTITITGIMTNTANTFALNAATGPYVLSGTILNGNVSISGTTLTISGGIFDGVTLASNLPVNTSTLTLKDSLTFSGDPTLSLNNGSGLNINTNLTIGGTGIVEFDGTSTASISNAGGALTIGPSVTFQTGTASGVFSPAGLTNQGLISAQTSGKTITISSANFTNSGSLQTLNGATLTINSSNWTNTGNITLDNTSILNLGGTFTTAAIGTINRTGGTINITGIMTNTANTFALTAATGPYTLSGTILNGNVSISGTTLTIASGIFDGVTLLSNLSVSTSALTLKDGLTFSGNPTLSLNNGSGLNINTNLTIGGTGIVQFDGTGTASVANAGGALTIGANVTFQTGTASGSLAPAGLTNLGLISAQTSGKTITINSTFTNSGTLQAINGGTLSINSNLTTAQLGTFNSVGGTLNINSKLDNSNATLTIAGAGNSLTLPTSGSIANGTLSITTGGTLFAAGGALNVPTINITGGNLHQTAGNITLSALNQSGGNASLGGAQTLYAIPTITITAGTTTLTKDALKVLTTTSLTLGGSTNAWTGGIDLTQNKLIVEATTQNKSTLLPTLENQALFGRSNPDGIFSSTAPSTFAVAVADNSVLNKTTFGGQPVDTNSLLVSPELLGDTDFSGHVDLTDLSTVLNNFGSITPAWTSGNFDGATTIDLTDLSDVLNNFGATNPNASSQVSGLKSQDSPSPAPEPPALPLLGIAIFALWPKRHPIFT